MDVDRALTTVVAPGVTATLTLTGRENRKSWLSCALHDLGGGYDFVMLNNGARSASSIL